MAEISVVIPVHNRADRLPRAVASVLEQTGPALELVVVDDGSEDDVSQSLAPFARDARLRLLRVEHGGVSRARNLGVAAGRAPLLAFLDSDDYWLPGKLRAQVAELEAGGGAINQTEEIWIRNGRRVNPPQHAIKRAGDLFLASLAHCLITPSSVLMTRALFDACGGFDESLPACEDYDLWLRVCTRHFVGLVAQPLLVRVGGHADQLSARTPVLDRFRVAALDKWLQANPGEARTDAVREVLHNKLRILENGYAKRGNAEGNRFCRSVASRYLANDPARAV